MKRTITALLFAAFSVPAAAVDAGHYMSVELGQVSFSQADVLGPTGAALGAPDFSDPATVRIGGGYRFSEYLAVDVGYLLNQDAISDSFFVKQTLKSSSLLVAVIGSYPVGEAFELFGKLGLANNKLSYSAPYQTQVSGLITGSATKTSVMFGLGAQYNIDRQWSIRLQYENLGKTHLTASTSQGAALEPGADIGMSAITVGNVYRF